MGDTEGRNVRTAGRIHIPYFTISLQLICITCRITTINIFNISYSIIRIFKHHRDRTHVIGVGPCHSQGFISTVFIYVCIGKVSSLIASVIIIALGRCGSRYDIAALVFHHRHRKVGNFMRSFYIRRTIHGGCGGRCLGHNLRNRVVFHLDQLRHLVTHLAAEILHLVGTGHRNVARICLVGHITYQDLQLGQTGTVVGDVGRGAILGIFQSILKFGSGSVGIRFHSSTTADSREFRKRTRDDRRTVVLAAHAHSRSRRVVADVRDRIGTRPRPAGAVAARGRRVGHLNRELAAVLVHRLHLACIQQAGGVGVRKAGVLRLQGRERLAIPQRRRRLVAAAHALSLRLRRAIIGDMIGTRHGPAAIV